MSKQVQFNFTLGTMVYRAVSGQSIYWGQSADEVKPSRKVTAISTSSPSSPLEIDLTDASGVYSPFDYGTARMLRAFFQFDLLAIPTNAVINSAILTVYFRSFQMSNTGMFPITFCAYRIFGTPDMDNSDFQYRGNATDPWSRYGLVEGVDYKLIEEDSQVVTAAEAPYAGSPSTGDVTLKKDFDLTAQAAYVMNTDARQLYVMLARSNTHRHAYPYLNGNQIPDIGGTYDGHITIWNEANKQVTLTITYSDALTFHPEDGTGAIDATTFIDTTTGGIWLFNALRVGGFGAAQKFFVKNNLTSSISDIAVFSQRSYGSKIPEMTRVTVGTGTISDITTVDKSVDQVNYTRTEQWRIVFTGATSFTVEHDNGTLDDPTQPDVWSAATPSTGTTGSTYTDTNTGVSFLITVGGTAFEVGDLFQFRTFEDDAAAAAPSDSDDMLLIAEDINNTPGTFQPMIWKPTLVTSGVSADTVVPVADTSLFLAGMDVVFTSRTTGAEIATRTIQTVGASSITLTVAVTLDALDYVEGVRIGQATLLAASAMPFWIQTYAPTGTAQETKYPRWRAAAS